eukprot:g1833.t1
MVVLNPIKKKKRKRTKKKKKKGGTVSPTSKVDLVTAPKADLIPASKADLIPASKVDFVCTESDKGICFAFQKGTCKRGADCKFLHTIGRVGVCKQFLEGKCRRSDKCPFSHSIADIKAAVKKKGEVRKNPPPKAASDSPQMKKRKVMVESNLSRISNSPLLKKQENISVSVSGFQHGARSRPVQPTVELPRIDWKKQNLSMLRKNFYNQHTVTAAMSSEEASQYRKMKQITVNGDNIENPITDFGYAGLPAEITRRLDTAGFKEPTPIQAQGLPIALSGRDIVGVAQTGSGKTCAFLLPALVHIEAVTDADPTKQGDGPICLVVSPTRELACQTHAEAIRFGGEDLKVALVFGGTSKYPQKELCEKGVDLIIATPGRLLDFLLKGYTNLMRCSYLVLDEADRMLDMGFEPDVREIVSQIRPDRQFLFFSATWPQDVRALASDLRKNNDCVQINIGSTDGALRCNHNITQKFRFPGDDSQKEKMLDKDLKEIVSTEGDKRVIVFVARKDRAASLAYRLTKENIASACSIHGDLSQADRFEALNAFKNGRKQIMVATDIAGRGIDVEGLCWIVNYDFPHTVEDYVHRIGRTGRAGEKGHSITYFTGKDARLSRDLVEVLKEAKQDIPKQLISFAKQPVKETSRERYIAYLHGKNEQRAGRGRGTGRGRGGRGGGRSRGLGGRGIGRGNGRGNGRGSGRGVGRGGARREWTLERPDFRKRGQGFTRNGKRLGKKEREAQKKRLAAGLPAYPNVGSNFSNLVKSGAIHRKIQGAGNAKGPVASTSIKKFTGKKISFD